MLDVLPDRADLALTERASRLRLQGVVLKLHVVLSGRIHIPEEDLIIW